MALGFLAAIAAAACYECGYLLQALEAREAPQSDALRVSLLAGLATRKRWRAGTALSALGAALQVTALALAPVTLVQPLLALGLVALLALAHWRLGEHVGRFEIAGVGLVIAGVIAVAAGSPGRSNDVDSVTSLVVLGGILAVATLLPFAIRERAPLRLAAVGAAAGDSLAAVALKLAANSVALGQLGFAVLAVAGGLAAGGLALAAEMSALRGIPASRVAPVVVAAQVIVPAIAAMTAFGEPSSAPVVLGVLVAGVGAALLGSSGAVAGLRVAGGESEALAHDGRGGGEGDEGVPG
jgi:drug/metabolite transporter (DMT)-like permease